MSPSRRAVFLLVTLLAAACSPAATTGPSTAASVPESPATPSQSLIPPADATPIEIVEVLDGDSLRAISDGRNVEVRLLGINAAERDECWSDRARNALRSLLDGAPAALEPAGGVDRFGRVLGYLYAADGTLVNLGMLEAGHAMALDTDHPMLGAFLAAEEAAFSAGAGWWQAGACGPATTSRVVVDGLRYDAPGPDHENPSGEWVEVRNGGPAADLSGWMLRDESSTHRFRFPNGTVLPAGAGLVVRSGCGDDREGELFWCADGSVWSNGGDTVLLLDDHGNVVDRLRYPGG